MRGQAYQAAAFAKLKIDVLRCFRKTMTAVSCRLRTDERGVATIELAVILPIISVLLMGLLDIGIFVHR